jgi:deazaflavin-dependent oxidoreductase (nitroreductase family)
MMSTKTLYHSMKTFNNRMVANYLRGIGPTRIVLLLTTIGRKTGQPRITPLQFEQLDDVIYIASARGRESDWFKNIQANPTVHIQMQQREFEATAEPVTDPLRIAKFLEMRLKRHPVMVRLIMHLFDGLPLHYSHSDLERISSEKAMVILHPLELTAG